MKEGRTGSSKRNTARQAGRQAGRQINGFSESVNVTESESVSDILLDWQTYRLRHRLIG